jgi:hypothetical protein
MNSVAYRTYLFLEDIYLKATDESADETAAMEMMGLIWNLLTKEEQDLLQARATAGENVKDTADAG